MENFAEKAISFYRNLEFKGTLPHGISIMNPYRDNPAVMKVVKDFYGRFYNDSNPRYIILGINPGRFGAGVTGITFTDSKRLSEKCGIIMESCETRELSSEFVYEMIERYGGVEKFFSGFYVSAVCPLGFILAGEAGKEVNFNYYDNKELLNSLYDFIVEKIIQQLSFGINREVVFCLGTGKNFRFLKELNEKMGFFKRIVPLEHPRFIMQYRRKRVRDYIEKYVKAFSEVNKVVD